MPEEGEDHFTPAPGGDMLTAEEIRRLVKLFVHLGIRKVRLTGGEPTIRGDFDHILQDFAKLNSTLEEPLSLGITTNGVRLKRFLPQLRTAGFRNINLSLDTLVAAKFPLLARKPLEWHARILEAFREVSSQDSFHLKLNCVLLRGVNEDEVGSFVDLTEKQNVEVRFLEFMPFDGNSWSSTRLVTQADITVAIQQHLASRGLPEAQRLPPDSPNDVARLWKVPGWQGRIGVISSMTAAFCGSCNRIRLTAQGELRNCLFGETGWNLRDALRSDASDDALIAFISEAVQRKHAMLGGKSDMYELQKRGSKALPMVALGG